MKTLVIRFAFSALLLVPLLGEPFQPDWIDLSYPFNNETIYWPEGLGRFEHIKVFEGIMDGYYYASYDFNASEHGGTHLNAPRHFAEGKWTTDQIPLDRLIGPAIKIDISSKADQNPDAQLMPSDLEAWEKNHGTIPDDVILLVFTNWGRHWPDKKKYLGSDTNDPEQFHFPGIHPSAASWLVQHRNIKLVGIDTASFDYGQSKLYLSHRIFHGENIPALENIANMAELPAKGFTVYAPVMPITGGSGGPCRVFAVLDSV